MSDNALEMPTEMHEVFSDLHVHPHVRGEKEILSNVVY